MTVSDVWEPRAFGGGILKGDNVTKFVHMDESGIWRDEPFCVQAGVIIDADRQWKLLEPRLVELVTELVPREFWGGYIFHAKDVFHGNDPAFSRERIPRLEDRAQVVRRFAGVTAELALPIAIGIVEKKLLDEEMLGTEPRSVAARVHALAYGKCVVEAEEWMRAHTKPEEVALLFVENNTESRTVISLLHNQMKTPRKARWAPLTNIEPLERIVENPNFCQKEPLSILQIADACAFSANRCLRKAKGWEILYEGIRHGVTSWPETWGEQSSP